jgi:hypothetical protein
MKMKKGQEFPIRTYQKLETDSMNALLSALGRLDVDESACIQILLRPVDDDWQDIIKKKIRKTEKKQGGHHGFSWNPLDWIRKIIEVIVQDPEESIKHDENTNDSAEEEPIDEEGLMKEKVKKTGYSTTIRVIVTGNDTLKTESELKTILSAFSQFASPTYNRFKPLKRKSLSILIEHYIYRQFAWWQQASVLNSEELATLFHFPHSKYNKQPEIRWQRFKVVKAPVNTPKE